MSIHDMDRRSFLARTGAAAALSALPVGTVRVAMADPGQDFTFAYISDAHIQHISGTRFVRNWDQGLKRAVAECNLMVPRPDFVVFGGDLAQLGTRPELDHGAEMLARLDAPLRCVMGEHDYYLDLGEYWSELFGDHYYSWDHKGVHFVVLNSILTTDEWTFERWDSDMQRMVEMAGLDNPNGSPFMVGDRQLKWLRKDLKKVSKDTPVVVFSHSPLQKIYKGWNFWTEEAEQVQALLAPFDKATVIYGHVHQIQYNQVGNIAFQSVMATAWPWPYPSSYAHSGASVPDMTVPMNRADPFHERDATGWQIIDASRGRLSVDYQLNDNTNRVVGFDPETGQPRDAVYTDPTRLTPAQTHF